MREIRVGKGKLSGFGGERTCASRQLAVLESGLSVVRARV